MATSIGQSISRQPGISRWWRVVGGLSMNLALGTLYAWSVFVAPLEKQFGWKRAQTANVFTIAVYEYSPREMLRTPTFYFMWVAYALGASAGLMVISQLVPFAISVGVTAAALSTMTLVVGAVGNASGRILSGWMSDKLGRINVLRIMIAISMIAMPVLFAVGGHVTLLYATVFVVYWCYGTQLSVNASTTSDFWGTKNAGINYGLLFTAWGVAGIIGPRIGGVLFDRYHDYKAAFYAAAVLAAVAFVCELLARRPAASTHTVRPMIQRIAS